MTSAVQTELVEVQSLALTMGDSCLILSQRLAEWCGKGPAIEEDMALTNTALDLLGQARMWLSLVGDEDQLAYHRDTHEFKNFIITELPNAFGGSGANTRRDYAYTLVRQFFFDAWHYLQLESLQSHADKGVAEIAAKGFKEVAYHVRRTSDLIVRLGDGTDESHERVQTAVNQLWPYTGEMFVLNPSLRPAWLKFVGDMLAEATLAMPDANAWMHKAKSQGGSSTEHLGYLLAEMQYLQRTYPQAKW
ncbi:MAG: phenylacetate-CoA oxygenase subunit PaaI [Pseudomonadota bacterium]|jgi:ring-1,2-phenylacetyl-CoA epoxidase subunit PaaC